MNSVQGTHEKQIVYCPDGPQVLVSFQNMEFACILEGSHVLMRHASCVNETHLLDATPKGEFSPFCLLLRPHHSEHRV
jgi:hypothetical protein